MSPGPPSIQRWVVNGWNFGSGWSILLMLTYLTESFVIWSPCFLLSTVSPSPLNPPASWVAGREWRAKKALSLGPSQSRSPHWSFSAALRCVCTFHAQTLTHQWFIFRICNNSVCWILDFLLKVKRHCICTIGLNRVMRVFPAQLISSVTLITWLELTCLLCFFFFSFFLKGWEHFVMWKIAISKEN